MKPFLTVAHSRTKRAHIVYLSSSTGKIGEDTYVSLCKTTNSGVGPRGKYLAHVPTLHKEIPQGYTLCRTCLLKAYESRLLDIEFRFDRTLVEIAGGAFRERPLTMEEYEEKKNE